MGLWLTCHKFFLLSLYGAVGYFDGGEPFYIQAPQLRPWLGLCREPWRGASSSSPGSPLQSSEIQVASANNVSIETDRLQHSVGTGIDGVPQRISAVQTQTY